MPTLQVKLVRRSGATLVENPEKNNKQSQDEARQSQAPPGQMPGDTAKETTIRQEYFLLKLRQEDFPFKKLCQEDWTFKALSKRFALSFVRFAKAP